MNHQDMRRVYSFRAEIVDFEFKKAH